MSEVAEYLLTLQVLAIILFVVSPFLHLFGAVCYVLLLWLKGGTLARSFKDQGALYALSGIKG